MNPRVVRQGNDSSFFIVSLSGLRPLRTRNRKTETKRKWNLSRPKDEKDRKSLLNTEAPSVGAFEASRCISRRRLGWLGRGKIGASGW